MTGPEHYREAERLLERATPSFEDCASLIARAQVHATLAAAAAQAIPGTTGPSGPSWSEVVLHGERASR